MSARPPEWVLQQMELALKWKDPQTGHESYTNTVSTVRVDPLFRYEFHQTGLLKLNRSGKWVGDGGESPEEPVDDDVDEVERAVGFNPNTGELTSTQDATATLSVALAKIVLSLEVRILRGAEEDREREAFEKAFKEISAKIHDSPSICIAIQCDYREDYSASLGDFLWFLRMRWVSGNTREEAVEALHLDAGGIYDEPSIKNFWDPHVGAPNRIRLIELFPAEKRKRAGLLAPAEAK